MKLTMLIGRSLSYRKKDFDYLCHVNVENNKMHEYAHVPSEKISM